MKKLYVYADFNWLKEMELICEFINMKTAEKIVSEVVEAVKEWREIAIRQGGRGVLSFRECRTVR